MTKAQTTTVLLGIVSATALAVVMLPNQRAAQESPLEKQRNIEIDNMILQAKVDASRGYQRQLRQGTITCEFKSDFQRLAAYNSLTSEILDRFGCREWDWPLWLSTDINKSDRDYVYVRLPLTEERWHWVRRTSIADYGYGFPPR